MLRELDTNLCVIDHAFSMPGGVQLGTRTTLVGRGDGKPLLIAPGELDTELCEQIEKRGPVDVILAPNNMHHLFVADCAKAFPAARLCSTRGVVHKQPELDFELIEAAAPLAGKASWTRLRSAGSRCSTSWRSFTAPLAH